MKDFMKKVQRFGGAMLAPTLLFSFAGIMVGLAIVFKNPDIVGAVLGSPESIWFRIWDIIAEGSWAVFRQMPLLFVIGLPISLAKKYNARACLEVFVIYVIFNYFLQTMMKYWGSNFGVDFARDVGGTSGLTMIAGIKTLDTGMFGALIISGVAIFLHNKFYEVELPDYLGIFRGSSFVVIIGFFAMLPIAFAFMVVWPQFQILIRSLQTFFVSSGNLGIWVYSFLEKILIPTGMHHFIYSPFAYDNAIVDGGTAAYWAMHLQDFATSAKTLKEMYPVGFSLSGMSKVFGTIGITAAFYKTARPEKRKAVAGLMIPVALTAALVGITEPLEFTFLFVAPILFVVHALLSATIATISFAFGVVGDFGGGLIKFLTLNWLPLGKYHWQTYLVQIIIGLVFIAIWYFVFVFLIQKLNLPTPGRESDDEEMKLYSKKEYQEMRKQKDEKGKKVSKSRQQAIAYLEMLGGKENIIDVTNCATRLRLTVKDGTKLASQNEFKSAGAMGLVQNGQAIQIIVGLSVPNVREEFESIL